MAVSTSIQESTKRPFETDGKSAGFTANGETQMDAAQFLITQANAILEQKYKKIVDEKDIEILNLRKIVEEQAKCIKDLKAIAAINQANKIVSLNPVAPPAKRDYRYDYTLFPKNNGDDIIDSLVELTNCKRENDRYVLVNKTDWYIVVKVLKYFGVYVGDEKDFLTNILPNIQKYMDDPDRIKKLSANKQNFATIDPESPIITIKVDQWHKKAVEERRNITQLGREGKKTSNAITALNRCVNIKANLCKILINHDVQLENY